MNPITILKTAGKNYPPLVYAWGAIGIAGAIAVIATLVKSDKPVVVIGLFVGMFTAMLLLAEFAKDGKGRPEGGRPSGIRQFLVAACAITFVFVLGAYASAVVTGHPEGLAHQLALANIILPPTPEAVGVVEPYPIINVADRKGLGNGGGETRKSGETTVFFGYVDCGPIQLTATIPYARIVLRPQKPNEPTAVPIEIFYSTNRFVETFEERLAKDAKDRGNGSNYFGTILHDFLKSTSWARALELSKTNRIGFFWAADNVWNGDANLDARAFCIRDSTGKVVAEVPTIP